MSAKVVPNILAYNLQGVGEGGGRRGLGQQEP